MHECNMQQAVSHESFVCMVGLGDQGSAWFCIATCVENAGLHLLLAMKSTYTSTELY